MQVYTFYTPLTIRRRWSKLKTLVNSWNQLAVLRLWKKTWRQNGWQTEVLGFDDARRAGAEWVQKLREAQHLYASGASRDYEMACYLRWVAMTARGGLMTDYDVMNRAFTPADFERQLASRTEPKALFLTGNSCPCAVGGMPDDFKPLIELFLRYEANPHRETPALRENVSDQNIFDAFPREWTMPANGICPVYGLEAGWETSPLVHFAHSAVRHNRARTIARSFQV